MAVTIDTQNNPTPSNTGQEDANATKINSGFTSGRITYEVRSRDSAEQITVSTGTTTTDSPLMVDVTARFLKIILRNRIEYKARAKQGNGAWTEWVNFKTRDKTYVTPSTVQLSTNNEENAGKNGSVTIRVTDTSKLGTVTPTARGARVNNADKGYVTTTTITDTARGARVVNNE